MPSAAALQPFLGGRARSLLTGLAAYWPLDNVNLTDLSGNGNTLSVSASSPTAAAGPSTTLVNGTAFASASTQYLTIADNTLIGGGGNTPQGWCCWGYAATDTGADQCIFGKKTNTGNQREWEFLVKTGTLLCVLQVSSDGTSANQHAIATATAITLGTWFFLSGFYDSASGTIGISLNGGPYATTPHAGGVFHGTSSLDIGREGGNILFVNGRSVGCGMWKGRFPRTGDVQWLYNSGLGRTIPSLSAGFR